MIRLRYITSGEEINVGELIPLFGMMTGIIIPLAVFFWQYLEGKERRETILEISKTIDRGVKTREVALYLVPASRAP